MGEGNVVTVLKSSGMALQVCMNIKRARELQQTLK